MGFEAVYGFLMDLILAFVLSGLFLAIIKRFYSRIVGMKKTTRLKPSDKIALTSLWLDFSQPSSCRKLYMRSIWHRKLPDRNTRQLAGIISSCPATCLSFLVALFTFTRYIFYSSSCHKVYAYSN